MTFALSVVSLFFLILTSLVGIYSLVEMLSKKIFDGDEKVPAIQLLSASGDGEALEWQIGSLLKHNSRIFIVDCGLNSTGFGIAKKLCDLHAELSIINNIELQALFEEDFGATEQVRAD